MRAAICDDRAEDAQLVAQYVREWGESREESVALEMFPSAEAFLFAYDEDKNFDLLLLDVEMGGMDGVTMAKRVRAENTAVQIVFITGYTDYIAEGYDVAALHYLVKPVREEKLSRCSTAPRRSCAATAARSRSSAAVRSSACRFMRSAISMWRKTTRPSTRSGIIP